MITYHYTARNSATGEYVKSTVEADSEKAANELIKREGLVLVDLSVDQGSPLDRLKGLKGRVKAKDKVLFSRQLSTLINAGLPLVQSLRSVNSQTTNKSLQQVIANVINDVEAGSTLSGAMAKHPKVFSRVYLSLIAAGETSGTLDQALDRLAIQQEKDADLVSKIKGAMTYPVIVLLVMSGVVGFMMIKVMPQVSGLYGSMPGGTAALPLITKIMISISNVMVQFWWVAIIVVAVAVSMAFRWTKTPAGRAVFDTLKMKAWPIAPLFMKMYMARFARTATTLVASGVPLIQVLEITGEAVNNIHIKASIDKAAEKVKGGKSLSESIKGDPNFLPLVPNMLSIGEDSGSMEDMLAKTAEYFEKEVDDQVKAISTIIEPIMMVLLGVVAFAIVAAVLLPIYGLANQSFV